VATSHVRITQGERVGTGEQAVYDKPAEKITITGAAQVLEGPNRVSGERIIFFINEDRSVVEGSSETKVEAVVYPSE
jgi:lipopolysaccharide export system protein LptA